MAAPLSTCTKIEQRGMCVFYGQKIQKQRISTNKCCQCTVNIACHVRQSTIGCRSSRKDGQERFPDDPAVERAVLAWFRQQPKEFFAAGFQGLVKQWDKCLNLYGDYVEK